MDDDPINAHLKAFIKNSGSFTFTSCTFSSLLGLFGAFVALSINEDLFKQFMQAYLAVQTTAFTAALDLALSSDASP